MNPPEIDKQLAELQAKHDRLIADLESGTDALRTKLSSLLQGVTDATHEARRFQESIGDPEESRTYLILSTLKGYGEVLHGVLDLICDPPSKRAEKGPWVHYVHNGRATCGIDVRGATGAHEGTPEFSKVTCPKCRTEVKALRAAAKSITFDIERMPLIPRPAVHLLHQGQPVCGFSTEVPGKWPEGHRWASSHDFDKVTCPACRANGQHYEIVGKHTGQVIGCTTGEAGKANVLAEEPGASFRPVSRQTCSICKEAGR